MRIQHNIAALNSYRQLSGNNNALSKNLEKLSSGYKINRAGDDAAGLAISEKMRAQIKGLEAATKNANDGISLVQTGEGALTEVHDMLNRMTYLATQSANGTYDNDVDRANLQKEVESLLDEIDRISESTNYNGLNLLDGTLGMNTSAFTDITTTAASAAHTATAVKIEEGSVVTSKLNGTTMTKASFDVSLKDVKLTTDGDLDITIGGERISLTGLKEDDDADKIATAYINELTAQNGAAEITIDGTTYTVKAKTGTGLTFTEKEKHTSDTILKPDYEVKIEGQEVDYKAGTKASFEVNLTGLTLDTTKNNIKEGDTFKLTVAGTTIESAKASSDKSSASATDITALFNNQTITIKGVDYKITDDSGKLKFEAVSAAKLDDATEKVADATSVTLLNGEGSTAVFVANGNSGTSASWKNGTNTIGTAATNASFKVDLSGLKVDTEIKANDKFTLTVGDKTIDLEATADITDIKDLVALADGQTVTIDGVEYKASASNASSTITFTATTAGKADAPSLETSVSLDAKDGAANNGSLKGELKTDTIKDAKDGVDEKDGKTGVSGEYIGNVTCTQVGEAESASKKAEMTFALDFDNIKDGTKLTIGDTEYTFAVGEKSKYTKAKNVIDLTNMEQSEITKNKGEVTTRLVDAIGDGNGVWEVGNRDSAAKDGKVVLLEKKTNQDAVKNKTSQKAIDLTTAENVKNSVSMKSEFDDQVSTTSMNLDATKMVSGDKIEIDGKVYEFVGDESELSSDSNIAVVVKGLSNATGTATGSAAAALKDALEGQGYTADVTDNKITISAKDMTSTVSVGSAGVALQVGDTADTFNKVNVKVGKMDSASLGIAGIDISTQEGAAAAIDKIKNAINSVSSTRGDLGAIQNRLEHTINNIGVTKENITDAESRIRDTDMAEEMMAYTKNNILVQAAQSMLAQANQVPQGVLQLLQ